MRIDDRWFRVQERAATAACRSIKLLPQIARAPSIAVYMTTLEWVVSVLRQKHFLLLHTHTCLAQVGIGIAFILDERGRFVVSHSVVGGPAHQAKLREGEILTHVDGVPLSDAKGASELACKLLGPQGSTVQVGS